MEKKAKSNKLSYAKYGYLFSIPFVLVYVVFSLYPTIYTCILGFTDCQGLGNTSWHILEHPLDNFRTVLSNNTFKTSFKNTIVMWIMNFIPQITIALLLTAWFTSRAYDLKGKPFFKVVFYMPNIITAASVAILFNALFSYPVGPVNDLLQSFGFISEPQNFLIDGKLARGIIAFIQFLTWYGNTMIVLTAGVLGISYDIFEAAEIDGANGLQTFFYITIPNLRTVLLYTLITSLVGGLNMYDIPKMFLNGGPDNATVTTNVFIYNQAFSGSYMYNRAAAASMLMFIVISACSGVLFYIMRDKDASKNTKSKKHDKMMAKLMGR